MKRMIYLIIIFLFVILSYSLFFLSRVRRISIDGVFIRKYVETNWVVEDEFLLTTSLEYYFSGKNENSMWLSNERNQLKALKLDLLNRDTIQYSLYLPKMMRLHRGISVCLHYPGYAVMDGYQRILFVGSLLWDIPDRVDSLPYFFDDAVAINDTSFIIRLTKGNEMQLALLNGKSLKESNALNTVGNSVLSRDGILIYDKDSNLCAYIYYYRNEYILMNKDLDTIVIGKTIDSITIPNIDVGLRDNEGQRMINTAMPAINAKADLSGEKLYILSNAKSSMEQYKYRRDSAVVDVYNVKKQKYDFSFRIPRNYKSDKLVNFRVTMNKLVLLFEHRIIVLSVPKSM